MKGIIIHGNPMWGDNERATYCGLINDATFELINSAPREITSHLEGVASKSSKAVCSEDDTYDFETGALIALMKMCGLEKSAKAYAEIFDDAAYGDALNERDKLKRLLCYAKEDINMKVRYLKEKDEEIEQLKEKNNGLYNLARKYVDEIDQKDHEIISLKALKLTNDSLKKDNELFRKTCEKLKEENGRLKNEMHLLMDKNNELVEKRKDLKKKLNAMYGYVDTDNVKPDLPRTLDINGTLYHKGVSLKDLHRALIPTEYTWELKMPTKREFMWCKIKNFKGDSCVEVDWADAVDFLKDLEKEMPNIHWPTGARPTVIKPMFNYKYAHEYDKVYFFIDDRYVTYGFDKQTSRTNVQYVTYLPPMRWDLFKKGRKIIRVTPENFGEAMSYIRANVNLATAYKGWESVIKNSFNKSHAFIRISTILKGTDRGIIEFMWPEDLVKKQLADPTVYSSNKIVDWEDVR